MIVRVVIALALIAMTAGGCEAAELELVSRSLLQGPARDAAFYDGGLLLALGGSVLVVPEGTALDNGTIVYLDGEPLEVAVSGQTAWAAVWGSGLVRIDLGAAGGPKAELVYQTPKASSCAATRRSVLIADNGAGLLLFDAADPARPRLADTRRTGNMTARCEARDDLFAVSMGDSVILMTVTEGGKLARASFLRSGSPVRRCVLAGKILLVLGDDGRIRRWDVTDPRSPEPLPPLQETHVKGIAFDGSRSLALRRDGALASFIPSGRDPLPIGIGFPGELLEARSGRCVLFGAEEGFHLYDISGSGASPGGSIETVGFAIEVTVRDGYVYLANGRGGLRIGRLGDDGAVTWTKSIPISDARDVAIAGKILVVACGLGGSRYFRLERPGEPREIGSRDSPFYLCSVVTTGTLACFAGGLGGAEIVDFSDPGSPRLLWRERFSEVRGLDTDGERLYLCDGFAGVKIFALGPRGRPSLLSSLDTPGWCCDAFVSGKTLYLADGGKGIAVADISDPRSPAILGSVPVGAIARQIHARGSTLFVAAQINGIAAVDCSDPRRPIVASRYQTVDDARGVWDDGELIYLASGAGGLYIFRYAY